PYWDPALREHNGLDQPVRAFLDAQDEVQSLYGDIRHYLERWLPRFEASNRSYMTVAVGCTGGQHRSVYICERLQAEFSIHFSNVQTRHRELHLEIKGRT
ncbi:MAG: RapZ C-terminal domain-containing protein, partial [Pseudomonadota bacterium]